jgi:hypothetical protein
MTFRLLRRLALGAAVFTAPWVVVGCGDSGTTTTIPSNPPPIPADAKGNPAPPPTAASPPTPARTK